MAHYFFTESLLVTSEIDPLKNVLFFDNWIYLNFAKYKCGTILSHYPLIFRKFLFYSIDIFYDTGVDFHLQELGKNMIFFLNRR